MTVQLVGGELYEAAFQLAEVRFGIIVAHSELFADFIIEIFQQFAARLRHRLVDFEAQFKLELIEGDFDFIVFAAALVNVVDAFFEIHAGLDGAQDFIARAEDTLEKLELLGEQFVHPAVSFILSIQKIDDDDIVLLAVAVAATDTLLDPLGIPREIVIHHERAELEIDALGPGLRGNHDMAVLAEVINEGRPHVGRFGARDAVCAGVLLEPGRVNGFRAVVGVRAIEKDDAVFELTIGKDAEQVILGFPGLGEDYCFLRRAKFGSFSEGNFEGFEEGLAFGVLRDGDGEFGKGIEVGDFGLDGASVSVGERR